MAEKAEAHLVFVPAPGMGHLISAIEFAKLLIHRDHRLYITVLVIDSPSDTKTRAYTQSLASSSFSQRAQLIILPQPHIPATAQSNPGSYMNALIENQKPNVKDAVSNLIGDGSSPPLAAFVVDMFCTTMIDVAREFGVPALLFFTSGIASLGFMLHVLTLRERDNVNLTELKDTDTELAIPSFANPVPAKVFPSIVLNKEGDAFFLNYVRGLKKADGIIVNSFEELESHAVHSFSDIPIYPVGPILNIQANDKGDESDIIKWLDDQPPSSVIFLCFGSMGSFDQDQVREIARALEDSGARFLWSLRKPPPMGSVGTPSDYTPQELAEEVLPERFLDRTAEIGRVIGWAPQAQVLAHRATGGFVSHCGWNSTLESIYLGVPIATWPLYAEQQINAFELVRELNMAVEIALDYRVEFKVGRNTLLSADKIERGIRDVLEKDGEVRKKAKEMSDESRKTLTEGGCSYSYLGRLIDYIMNESSNHSNHIQNS